MLDLEHVTEEELLAEIRRRLHNPNCAPGRGLYRQYVLREFADGTLADELERRQGYRRNGYCDYCGRPSESTPACAAIERHFGHRAEPDRVGVGVALAPEENP